MDQQFYDHYPENMRLSDEEKKATEKMISIGANKRKIKMELMKGRNGKAVMVKQIHNVESKMKQGMHDGDNDIQKLYDILVTYPGAKVRFLSNQANELVGKLL